MTAKPLRLVIVGRPNVGKSSLFNRLLGRRRALVHDEPGVTRDRLEEKTEWWYERVAYPIVLVDTGGLGHEKFGAEIERQVEIALSEATVVLLVFDGKEGYTTQDKELIRKFKRAGVDRKLPFVAAVNKIDADQHEERSAEFYEAGIDPLLTISAEHGRGIDDLKEAILRAAGNVDEPETDKPKTVNPTATASATVSATDPETDPDFEQGLPGIALIGRPNVGKSTFINAVLGEERMITSPIAGTTVDAVDSVARLGDKEFRFIDTAGIRRKSKTEQGVEVLSVVQARKALERADLAILLLDGEKGITDQDEKVGGLIEEVGCSVILAVNKWDTQRNTGFKKEDAADRIRKQMAHLKYAPILFVSAIKRQGFDDLGELIEEILHQRKLKIPTHEFTTWVRQEATVHNPKNAKFFMCHQSGRHPPTFVCHVSDPDKIHFSLRRHLVNALRERWGYMGSPVRMLFVKGGGQKR
jgi:GTP-binding protein